MSGVRSLDRWRASRRRVARTVGGEDRYGVVLVLIIFLIIVLASGQDQTWTRPGGVALVSAVLLYTLSTSGVRRRVLVGVLVALAVVFALSILEAAALYGQSTQALYPSASVGLRFGQGLADLFMLVLVVITEVVIARRVVSHPVIEFNTVAGALSIYLLVGFCFATIFRLLPALSGEPFFTTPHAGTLDFLWFSYVTLTTVGYGDLIPLGGVGKMLAVTEALLGQIYLVTIVALFVSNIGRPRRRARLREHPEQSNRPGEQVGRSRDRAPRPRARSKQVHRVGAAEGGAESPRPNASGPVLAPTKNQEETGDGQESAVRASTDQPLAGARGAQRSRLLARGRPPSGRGTGQRIHGG